MEKEDVMKKLPCISVNLDAMKQNAATVCDLCRQNGISVAGVVKFSDCDTKCARAYIDGGCAQIAVSRAVHLKKLKKEFPEVKTLLTRAPTRAEIDVVAKYADLSLHSDIDILRRLDKRARALGCRPGVILMLDIGDLREGVYSIEELVSLAVTVENELTGLRLAGVGTNLACLNGVLPTVENLSYLVSGAEAVEAAIGRRLDIISGGSSINLLTFKDGKTDMPSRVNHLRIGGFIANPINMRINRDFTLEGTRCDSVTLTAEIVEIREKDSKPKNTSARNWAGKSVSVIDKGRRLRAILAIGGQDIGDYTNLIPTDSEIELVGGSSDHTIVDLTDSKKEWHTGEVVTFAVKYAAMLYAFSGKHVSREYLYDEKE